MRSEQPIFVTPDQHLAEITRHPLSYRERLEQMDQRALDILYDDQLRQIARAMIEDETEKHPGLKLGALVLNCLFWLPVVVIAWEILRP